MKRFIIYVLFCLLCHNGFAQKTNEEKSNTDWGEVGMSVSAFSYGILSQGVSSITGTYSLLKDFYFNPQTYREISDITWEDIKNADYKEFGKSLYEPFAEGLGNTMYNAIHGDAESRGRSVFDVGMIVYGAKGTAQSVSKVLPGSPKPVYHYTNKAGYENITKSGLKVNKEGLSYTTPDGTLSPLQAHSDLALPANRPLPTHKVEIRTNIEPVQTRRTTGNMKGYGTGGGTEVIFNKNIPATDIVTQQSVTPYALSYTLAGVNTLNNQQEITEGGHKLNSQIKTIVLLDETIEKGFFKQILKSNVMYVILNEVDLPRVNSHFLANLTNGNSNEKFEDKEVKIKTRNEVVPNKSREERGLK